MIGTYDDLCNDCRTILEERERVAPRLDRLHQMWIDQYLLRNAMCMPGDMYGTAALVFRVFAHKIPGGFAECGVGAGVHPAVMHYCMRFTGEYRTVWLFDSFQGIPKATQRDIPSEDRPGFDVREILGVKDGIVETNGRAGVPLEQVKLLMRAWGATDEHLRYVPGWFHETLPQTKTGPLAMLRVDADVYESTKVVLDALYDNVSIGGYVLTHDWDFSGVQSAVVDSLGFMPDVHDFPETGPHPRSVWWEKS